MLYKQHHTTHETVEILKAMLEMWKGTQIAIQCKTKHNMHLYFTFDNYVKFKIGGHLFEGVLTTNIPAYIFNRQILCCNCLPILDKNGKIAATIGLNH